MGEFKRIRALPTDALAPLLAESAAEGFRFVERLSREWREGNARFDQPGELLLAAYDGETMVAIGGLPTAARFYETLGYTPLPPGGTATHRRIL